MQILIDIPEDIYKDIMGHNREMREGGKSAYYFEGLIQNGTPLPKRHDRLVEARAVVKALFDKKTIDDAPTIIEADKGE